MENEQLVLDAFNKAGAPMSSKQIAESTGLEKKVVDKIIKKLKTEERIRSPKNCYYEPV